MKKYLPVIAVPIVLYFISAFMAWEFNPGKWDPLGRVILGLIGIFIISVSIGYVKDNSK